MLRHNVQLQIDGSFFILLVLMLMLLPIQWVAAVFTSIMIHECFHALMIYILQGRIFAFRLGIQGIQMETDYLPPARELIAAIAGPLGSASLIALAPWFPRTAICGFIHFVYNMIPLYPLDGGRIMKNGLKLIFEERSERIFEASQRLIRIFAGIICIFICWCWGVLPTMCGLLLFFRLRWKRTV